MVLSPETEELVGTISVLSLYLAGADLHSPTDSLKLARMCSTHRGCLLIAWLWWPGELVFLGFTGLNQRNSPWQVTIPWEPRRLQT